MQRDFNAWMVLHTFRSDLAKKGHSSLYIYLRPFCRRGFSRFKVQLILNVFVDNLKWKKE